MRILTAALVTAVASSLSLSGAMAQGTTSAPRAGEAQQVNPTPMAPGTRAGDAPGMGSTGGRAAQGEPAAQANPTQMPPGSRAGDAGGMNPGVTPGTSAQAPSGPGAAAPGRSAGTPLPGTTTPGNTAQGNMSQGTQPGTATPVPGTTTAQGSNPDRGQAGGMGAQAPSGQPDVARGTAPAPGAAPTTGATTPNTGMTGGGTAAAPRRDNTSQAAGAPVAGANSFTEGQARARIGDAGFNDVQGLTKDDQGIWRGRAIRNGQQVGVALDYQGNVVATQ